MARFPAFEAGRRSVNAIVSCRDDLDAASGIVDRNEASQSGGVGFLGVDLSALGGGDGERVSLNSRHLG